MGQGGVRQTRKYYRITDLGSEEMASLRQQWRVVDATLRATSFHPFQMLPQGS